MFIPTRTSSAHAAHAVLALSLALGAAYQPLQAATPVVATAAASDKLPITHEVYASWRSITGATLSRDGRFAAYALVAQEADGELVVRRMADGQEWRAPRGTAPVFSADGRYVAFAVQPTRAALDKHKKDRKAKPEDAPKAGVGVMDTADGQLTLSLERVKRFAWPEEAGNHLAVQMEAVKKAAAPATKTDEKADEALSDEGDQVVATNPAGDPAATGPAKKKEPGTELLLIDAATGARHSLDKEVAEFQWTRDGEWLAFSVSTKPAAKESTKEGAKDGAKPEEPAKPADAGDPSREGVYLLKPADPTPRAVLKGAGSYKQMQFDHAGRQLAFVSNRDHLAEQARLKAADRLAEKEPTPFKLYRWSAGAEAAALLVSADTAGMPSGWTPSEHAALNFSKDGQRLFLGTALLPRPEAKDAPEPLKVDLWHWKDPTLQSMQKVNADKERQRSYRALVHLAASASASPADSRFVQLATPAMPDIVSNENARFALGLSDVPYRQLMSWDASYHDAYAVDLQTGTARPLASKLRVRPTLSPGGRYVLGYLPATKGWSAWRSEDGKAIALTARISGAKTRFDDVERDTPEPASPYGVTGWTANDEAVVLNEQFDLWEVQPATLAARNITGGWGRQHQTQLRYVPLDPKDEDKKALPTDAPWMLTGVSEADRSTGFYALPIGAGAPVELTHGDKLYGGIIKARLADQVLFTEQSYREFPDLWASRLDLRAPQKISAANPQQGQYRWGTQEMIEYTAANGRKLKALLTKPENFDPKKKYPMMVYIYEKMSDKLHNYVPPAPGQNINLTRYTSNGYLVLRPDIVYTTGHPGKSALDTVLPAIHAVEAKGYVDSKHIGIQGHSWGAYQISYMITRTHKFAAAEAGASMANMISGYGGIRWGTGVSRAFQYEKQQSRMGTTPWANPALYVENSPIFQVDKVTTPFLTIHNDDDDAVPWYQAIEFFTAMRRLGKEAYWFNYNGAKHGLRDREQMKHYTVHMAEFFDHYLQGAPRPEWMDKPVPWLERGTRDVMGQFRAKEAAAASSSEAASPAK